MADFLVGIVIFLTIGGWIWLLGFLYTDRKERRDATNDNMTWARADERIIMQYKVKQLPVVSDMYGEASVRLEDVLAIINRGSHD